jgi:ubiquinone/menaquinone biosynthesis C-methylase UbiE
LNLQQLQDAWNRLGKDNALWAVLTSSNQWDPEAFFETGRQEIAELMSHLGHLSLNLDRHKALDFGCGVGRLSQALAEYFDEVHGVDIASSMIQSANDYNRHGAKCQFHLNSNNDLQLFPDSYFDLTYSNIVLQHMATSYTKGYLVEFLRTLKPEGVLVFQLPSTLIVKNPLKRFLFHALPESFWITYRRVKWTLSDWLRRSPRMEMYGIEKTKVIAFLSEKGGKVIDVRRDTRPTANQSSWENYLYTVVKV